MLNAAKAPFSSYIDFAAQIEPQLVLVGGVYNFAIEKSDRVLLGDIAAQKPHIGCMVAERDNPYLLLLLRLSQPLDSFETCEVSIQKPERTICWRMFGPHLYSLPKKSQALSNLQRFSDATRSELAAMQDQYNRRFNTHSPLDFFTAVETL